MTALLALVKRVDDRLAAQMTWHTGHDLAQTVFTCLYTLHLDQIASIPTSSSVPDNEHEPPPELLSLVLHSYILGTFKCIELAMQEYARGNVREVSLPSFAFHFRSSTDAVYGSKKTYLPSPMARISLQKSLFSVLSMNYQTPGIGSCLTPKTDLLLCMMHC